MTVTDVPSVHLVPSKRIGRDGVHHLQFPQDESDVFFRTVKARVAKVLRERKVDRFGRIPILLKAVVFGGATISFYTIAVFGNLSTLATLSYAVLFGISALLFAINVGHDAAHETIVPSRTVNRLLQFIAFAPLGADAALWRLRHVKSHHISPNVSGFDVDVGENGIIRLSPHQNRYWFNRWQAWYAPFVFWLVDLHSVLFYDFKYLLEGRMANVEQLPRGPMYVGTFILQKLLFFTIMFFIPLAVMERPWWQIALGALVVTFVNSLVFVYLLIGTHHCEETAYPEADAKSRMMHGWAHHQLATSMDWSPLNPAANFIMGGANAHAAHHLFPNVSHVHYSTITRIIQEEAKRCGMPYHQSTLPHLIISHIRHLNTLGKCDISN